jgi:hypothetical protein
MPANTLWVAREVTPDERAQQLAEHCRRVEAAERRLYVGAAVLCLLWSVAGVAAMAWSVSTRNVLWAPVAFWCGLGGGYAGVLITLAETYRRALVADGEI